MLPSFPLGFLGVGEALGVVEPVSELGFSSFGGVGDFSVEVLGREGSSEEGGVADGVEGFGVVGLAFHPTQP
jgi:hypothetical protein